MNYYFYEDGTYNKSLKNKTLKFEMIDISTDRKGPLYTLVKDPITTLNKNDKCEIVIFLNYSDYDMPFSGDTAINSFIDINSVSRWYNTYPLIKQMIGFNQFIELDPLFIGSNIYISNISINYNKNIIEFDEYSSDKYIKKIFRKLNMMTNVSEILGNNDAILMTKKGKWIKIAEFIQLSIKAQLKLVKGYDKIVLPLENMESVYVLSIDTYLRFLNISNGKICAEYSDIQLIEMESYEDYYDDTCLSEVPFDSIKSILKVSILIPELILLEQTVYNQLADIKISFNYCDTELKLDIKKSETKKDSNVCFINILDKMTKLLE